MRSLREQIAHVVLGLFGAVAGVLSGIAMALAAVIPPIIGLFAVLLYPLRVLLDWLRRPRDAS